MKGLFDVVSCQFAIHYSFSTEKRARKAFENISKVIALGRALCWDDGRSERFSEKFTIKQTVYYLVTMSSKSISTRNIARKSFYRLVLVSTFVH